MPLDAQMKLILVHTVVVIAPLEVAEGDVRELRTPNAGVNLKTAVGKSLRVMSRVDERGGFVADC